MRTEPCAPVKPHRSSAHATPSEGSRFVKRIYHSTHRGATDIRKVFLDEYMVLKKLDPKCYLTDIYRVDGVVSGLMKFRPSSVRRKLNSLQMNSCLKVANALLIKIKGFLFHDHN